MYITNIVLAGGLGLACLIAPSAVASFFGVPQEGGLWAAGYAYSYMVGLGIFGLLGLRSPMKFSGILLLQATGKIIWIIAIALPGIVGGTLQPFTGVIAVMFAFWAFGDLLAVPFHHFLAK